MPPVEADAPVIRDADGPWIELPGTFPMLFSERVASFDDLAAKDRSLRIGSTSNQRTSPMTAHRFTIGKKPVTTCMSLWI